MADVDPIRGPARRRNVLYYGLAIAALAIAVNAPAATLPDMALDRAVKVDFSRDAIIPTPAESAAIRRAAAKDMAEFAHPEKADYTVARADLDDDGHPDLLVEYNDLAWCGSLGCSGAIVMATAHGYARTRISLPNFVGIIDVLPTRHRGMHDLYLPDAKNSYFLLTWDGQEYR